MTAFHIGFVIFPDMTQLDFTGPLQVLALVPGVKTHILAKSRAAVPTDCGLAMMPTLSFEECPPLDMICVPGGSGVRDLLDDAVTVDFVRRQSATARFVTSVCTGAFVLGAAGLLKGRKATTHWAYTELLPLFGATHEKQRVVRDGPVITAGGVTSGIDFGLQIAAEIAGADTAEAIQLVLEYDPAPPFESGHPDKASEAARCLTLPRMEKSRASMKMRIEALPGGNNEMRA